MKTLTLADYQAAATLLRTGVPEIKAVAKVESRGNGFLRGRLVIRFEGHRFQKYTKGRYDKSHPTLSHPYMKNCPYNKGQDSEYKRLAIAMSLEPTAALMSCSWGVFQIMGDEFWRCGFTTVHEFIDSLKTGELAHLNAFCKFLVSKKLDGYLRNHEWDPLAAGYNGLNYRDNDYAGQMQRQYQWELDQLEISHL
jgi:hypothetical protein